MATQQAAAVEHRPAPPAVPAKVRAEAAKDAERVLDTVWRGRGRPVDAFMVGEGLGVAVYDVPLSEDLAGCLLKQPGKDPKILVNIADHPSRQRYSCAYHLGRFARHRGNPDEYVYEGGRDIFGPPGAGADEVYAAEFAAALLMPADEVRWLRRHGWTELDLPLRFGVPREVLHYRLESLGLD